MNSKFVWLVGGYVIGSFFGIGSVLGRLGGGKAAAPAAY